VIVMARDSRSAQSRMIRRRKKGIRRLDEQPPADTAQPERNQGIQQQSPPEAASPPTAPPPRAPPAAAPPSPSPSPRLPTTLTPEEQELMADTSTTQTADGSQKLKISSTLKKYGQQPTPDVAGASFDEIFAPISAKGLGRESLFTTDDTQIPELEEVFEEAARRKLQQEKRADINAAKAREKIRRSDTERIREELLYDPFADTQFERFVEDRKPVDAVGAVFGEGLAPAQPFLGFIPTSFLQTGHLVLLFVVALCGLVEDPGNPLTNLPLPIRNFFVTGLGLVFAVNVVLSALSISPAIARKQPWYFWAFKTLLLGGLAYDELMQIPPFDEDPSKRPPPQPSNRFTEASRARAADRGDVQAVAMAPPPTSAGPPAGAGAGAGRAGVGRGSGKATTTIRRRRRKVPSNKGT